ncbi:MAG: HEPN domain protein [Chlorobi bacterium OLB5]|nr:MAG: HEPN domain protein [Chlorobi bacterium OLB5]
MTDSRIKKWLISANNDFMAAGNLLFVEKDKIITNVICYLAQQSCEKFLKAFLLFKTAPFPKTHNLELLIEKCKQADAEFPDLDTGRLTSYNISMRYPDEFRIPSIDEAKESYVSSKSVRNTVLDRMNISENDITLFDN